MAIETSIARAPYAAEPRQSRGRRVGEPPSPSRNDFRRDCDRVIHSTAFRRLAYKTQVFVYHEGDHYRTRLTHTLEVVQIARSLARALGLDEDLAEGVALAHDLGHPPFGHVGERVLDECMRDFGGFDHNAQTLRVVTALEHRYASFDGLNLTWETLEGLVKHNGPLIAPDGRPVGRYAERGVPGPILAYSKIQDLDLWSFASAEAQVAALADGIAYDAHDIDDGLRARLFSFEELGRHLDFGGSNILGDVDGSYSILDSARRAHETVRRLISFLIDDVVRASNARLAQAKPTSSVAVRALASPVVVFSAATEAAEAAVHRFLYAQMYRAERVMRIMQEAGDVVRDLFGHYAANPQDLPPEWREGLARAEEPARLRRITDYIAGMTDRYALIEHARFFPVTPQLT